MTSISSPQRPELSIVVLCYRSEERIIPYLEQMERELMDAGVQNYELVLVGNYFPGAADRTPDVIKTLAERKAQVVPVVLEKKGMMGWDVITGLRHAHGEAIALIDGDGQMPSKDIVRLYQVLKSGEFDFVKTYRIKRLDGMYRRIMSRWYNVLFHLLFPGAPFRDINSKPKLFTRDVLGRFNLTCEGWFSDGEIMLEVRRLNLSFAEIPTVFYPHEWRGSFVNILAVFEMIGYMVFYRVKYWIGK